jgi:putative integral membrane protein (TIGR02587 family)
VNADREYAKGLGRAFIGAALFALPLFMTMEMWQLGFTVDRLRLAALLAGALPMLVALSYFAGFERAFGLLNHLLDVFAAIAVAALSGALILTLFGVLAPAQPFEEIVSKVAAVTVPGAIGALLADKQLNNGAGDAEAQERSYGARLFLMAMAALFVAFNVAPTEEMILIAFQISPWQALLLALASLTLLPALLFWVDFPGRAARRGDRGFWSVLVRFSFAGYGICVFVALALLWVFGRTDHASLAEVVEFVVVLSFPAALGAGLAHFVVGEQRG